MRETAVTDSRFTTPPTTVGSGWPSPHAARPLWVGRAVAVFITLGLLGVIARVVHLQMNPPQRLQALLDTQYSKRPLLARRGSIIDRQGRVLAVTRQVPRLFVDPYLIVEPNTFSERLGHALGYDGAELEKRLAQRPDSRYVVIDPQLSEERQARLAALKLEGVATEPSFVRDYPLGTLAGQVVGFVGRDGVGLEGVEQLYNQRMLGEAGKLRYLRDARREPLWVDQVGYTPPADGQPLRLSLDVMIQHIAEQALVETCAQYSAQSAQAVVMQPYTGEILALANVPAFDPNAFKTSTPEQRRNRCITDVFEPGSTFKPFVWAAAVESGFARPEEMIDCTTAGVYVTPFGRRLRDAHAIGEVTFEQALVKSSNIAMAIVGQRMGAARMWHAVRSFGFGQSTQCGLRGEIVGIVNPLKQWTMYSVTSVPMGQEIAVTPVQLARGFCTFANGGYLVQPTILARDLSDPRQAVPVLERVLSHQTAMYTRQVLRRVITEGTGRKASDVDYSIFGKTGTAQVPDRVKGGYLPEQYTSVFICGAPVESPQVVVLVVVHRPDKRKGYYGGIVAAPPAARIVQQTLNYLGVPPDNLPEQPQPDAPARPVVRTRVAQR